MLYLCSYHTPSIDIIDDKSDPQSRYFKYPQLNVNSDYDRNGELDITSVEQQPKDILSTVMYSTAPAGLSPMHY